MGDESAGGMEVETTRIADADGEDPEDGFECCKNFNRSAFSHIV